MSRFTYFKSCDKKKSQLKRPLNSFFFLLKTLKKFGVDVGDNSDVWNQDIFLDLQELNFYMI